MTVWSLSTWDGDDVYTSLYLTEGAAYCALAAEIGLETADDEYAEEHKLFLRLCGLVDAGTINEATVKAFDDALRGSGKAARISKHEHPWVFLPEQAAA